MTIGLIHSQTATEKLKLRQKLKEVILHTTKQVENLELSRASHTKITQNEWRVQDLLCTESPSKLLKYIFLQNYELIFFTITSSIDSISQVDLEIECDS